MKKYLFSLMKCLTLLLLAFLLNSCGVTTLHISEGYQTKLHQPIGSEEVIGRVTVEGDVWEILVKSEMPGERYTPRNPPPNRLMGEAMTVNVTMSGRYYMIKSYIPELGILVRQEIKRHPHEDILDELLNEAQSHFPNEVIDIRNATEGYRYIGMGKILRRKVESNGNGTSRTVRASEIDQMVEVPVYQFRIIFYADIVKITPLIR